LLPAELRPRWQRWLGRPARWLAASFATSLAAWLGSLPLTAWYFHIFNPISLLANLVIVPLSSLALMSGLGSLCCGDWLPWVGELFNHSAWFWMTAMVRASEWAASVRGGWWNVSAPGPLFFLFYYTTLVAALAGWFLRPRIRAWTISAVVVLGVSWGVESWRARNETKLTVFAVSGGHAVFLDQPARANDWLMDTANSSGAEFVTVPFLRAQGVNRLAHIVLTQGDVRQMGGANLVSEMFRPREFVTSTAPARSPYYRKFIADLTASGRPWQKVNRGAQLGPWRVLHPDATDRFAQADDNALVLAGNFKGTRVLLLPDLGRDGQEALLRREPGLRADIVIAGLPTKDEPLCDALLDAVKPKLIVLTDSEFPATRRASRAMRERLAQRGVTVLYTRETSAVVFDFKSNGWQATSMNTAGPD
jgi:beta-lactamase superfamily II metal-dependent hydrolase